MRLGLQVARILTLQFAALSLGLQTAQAQTSTTPEPVLLFNNRAVLCLVGTNSFMGLNKVLEKAEASQEQLLSMLAQKNLIQARNNGSIDRGFLIDLLEVHAVYGGDKAAAIQQMDRVSIDQLRCLAGSKPEPNIMLTASSDIAKKQRLEYLQDMSALSVFVRTYQDRIDGLRDRLLFVRDPDPISVPDSTAVAKTEPVKK